MMKTILIILGALLLLFIAFQIYLMSTSQGIEEYPYKVVKTYDDFEIRKYESTLFASVKMSTSDYDKASSGGFRVLGGYIFGGNEKNEKIAMTSPVTMSLEDSMTVTFMVPKKYKKEDLPKPDNGNIDFVQEPEKTVAAIRFGGWANDDKIEKYKKQLKDLLDKNGIAYTDKSFFMGYNPPYETINRRNEVIIELVEEKS